MTSRKFGDFFDPLCQTKIACLLTTLYSVTKVYTSFPPNCVTSFMNGPYAKVNKYSL